MENAVTLVGDTAYFTTSGGLVQGWDLSSLRTGQGEIARTFRFWTGDDTDATIVADEEGPVRRPGVGPAQRSRGEVGQLLKLDPRNPDNPIVWSIADQGASSGDMVDPGVVSRPDHLADVASDRSTASTGRPGQCAGHSSSRGP